MTTNEDRLRAMIDPKSQGIWNLNAEDRTAIQWALDAIASLKAERDQVRQEWSLASHAQWERSKKIELAADELIRVLGGS